MTLMGHVGGRVRESRHPASRMGYRASDRPILTPAVRKLACYLRVLTLEGALDEGPVA